MLSTLAVGFFVDWSGQGHNLFNYFGYFTNLTSLLAALTFIVTGAIALAGRSSPYPLVLARAVATTCLLLVAVVYNGFVPGTGSAPPWVSVLLHFVYPTTVVLDWILISDRLRPAWSQLWWVFPYPLVWMAVVLLRGTLDGWVPYGFLLPDRGILALVLTTAGLVGLLLIAGSLVWVLSRVCKGPHRV
ncbi:Pr6Pr family membrane protein [Microbacterium indicum]|uniref:Pr6Pr family membrane protein n=1 Tax=Microbacterium indicum TaxID=358100 RepID=UPI001B7FAAC9|nr:Pr6Pr family membrane protein [Microbacterium indicum]